MANHRGSVSLCACRPSEALSVSFVFHSYAVGPAFLSIIHRIGGPDQAKAYLIFRIILG